MKMKRIAFPKVKGLKRGIKGAAIRDMRESAARSVRSRSFRLGGYSVLATVVVVAIAVMVNVFVRALPADVTQIDTSASKLVSLSEQTESLVGALKDRVDIYWLVQSGQEDATLESLLNRYKSLNKEITIIKKDPEVYPTFAQEYTSEQVTNNSLVVVCGDRSKYVAYDGQIYEYDYSDYYTTGSYETLFAGEGALTSAIGYVTSDDLPKAYALEGHGEVALDGDLAAAVERENIEVESLSLLSAGSVPDDANLLMVISPQSDISTDERSALLSYLAGGGRMLLISDTPQEEGGRPNLESLMNEYGVKSEKGVVIETSQNNYVSGTPYYLLPEIAEHDITAPLIESGYFVLLPVAQGLIVDAELRNGLSVTELLKTTDQSYSKVAGYGLETYEKEDGDIDGPFAVAVAVTDTHAAESADGEAATSDGAAATSDGAVADGEATAEEAVAFEEDAAAEETATTGSAVAAGETRLVWVSATSVLDSQVNAQVSGGNYDFLLNSINWMCDQEDTLTIHAKNLENTSLTVPSGTSTLLSALFIVIIPGVIIAFGIAIFIRRRRR